MPAPSWSAEAVVSKEFKKISSQEFLGKWLVLFFYPFGIFLVE
jgi:peroxiredoxin (alkyl hydroperoxide reductase subunit C)